MRVSYRTLIVAAALAGTAIAAPSVASAAAGGRSAYTAIPGSTGPAPGKLTGRYTARSMTVEVSLLSRGAATTARSVEAYLRGQGLSSGPGSSPTLVRAVGSSTQVSGAFRTTLSTYTGADGARYYSNSTPVYLPAHLAPRIIGVIGLSNTLRLHALARQAVG